MSALRNFLRTMGAIKAFASACLRQRSAAISPHDTLRGLSAHTLHDLGLDRSDLRRMVADRSMGHL